MLPLETLLPSGEEPIFDAEGIKGTPILILKRITSTEKLIKNALIA
jgi:hypothetical protein